MNQLYTKSFSVCDHSTLKNQDHNKAVFLVDNNEISCIIDRHQVQPLLGRLEYINDKRAEIQLSGIIVFDCNPDDTFLNTGVVCCYDGKVRTNFTNISRGLVLSVNKENKTCEVLL